MITQQISPNPITGLNRVVQVAQVAYMDWEIKEAQIKFKIIHLKDDQEITALGFTSYKTTHINNSNRVTEQGVMITKDYVASISKLKKDSETYEQDLEAEYQKELEKGIPEFDMWMSMSMQLNLEEALKQGITLLDSFKFFDV